MKNFLAKCVKMLILTALVVAALSSEGKLCAQNNQQNQAQVFPSLIGNEFRGPNGYVYLGDKIYLCQNNVLTRAYEVVNVGKTIVIKGNGTYIKNGVTQTLLPGTRFDTNGEILK